MNECAGSGKAQEASMNVRALSSPSKASHRAPGPLAILAAIMQLHPGWVGLIQKRYLKSLGCLWFNRTQVGGQGCQQGPEVPWSGPPSLPQPFPGPPACLQPSSHALQLPRLWSK